MEDAKPTTIRFRPAIRERIERYAERHGLSFAAAVSTLVVRALDAEEGKPEATGRS